MSGIVKTEGLKRVDLAVDLLDPNVKNPNKMTGRAFDLLVDNIERTGLTDPILVRPAEGGRYRIVGGHHRFDAARYLGFAQVPCTVIDDPGFDDEAESFQLVRMNVIRGKMDPAKFLALYGTLADKYTEEVMQDLFGFAEEAEFRKLVDQSAKALPKDLQQQFKEAAKEVKTIDGLAKLLNEMFTKYGDSLPFGYMVIDFGGQESIWLQASKKSIKACYALGTVCREKSRTMDDLVGRLIQRLAAGELPDLLDELVASTPAVVMPAGLAVTPTKDAIAQAVALQNQL